MPNIGEWAAAGLDAVHVSARNANGWLSGFADLETTDTDTHSGMRRLKGAQVAPIGISEPNLVPVRGDNKRQAVFRFQGDNTDNFVLEMGIRDQAFEALAQGSTVLTVGEWDFSILGSSGKTYKDLIFLLTRDAEGKETGSSGNNGFENLLVLTAEADPIGDDQFADSEAGGSRYSYTPGFAEETPWGASIATGFTLSDGYTISWFSEYRCIVGCWMSDGVEDDFNIDYTPISAAKTKAWNGLTGVALTVSGVTPSTKNIALSAVPLTGVPVIYIAEVASF